MSSNLIELYAFLKAPTKIDLQNKVRDMNFEEVKTQAQAELGRIREENGWRITPKDSYQAFIEKICFDENALSKTVGLLLRIVDSKDEGSSKEVYGAFTEVSFAAELGFIEAVEAFLATNVHDVALLERALSSAVICNRKELIDVLLKKDLANELLKKNWSVFPIINVLLNAVKMGHVDILAVFDEFFTKKQFKLTSDDLNYLLSTAYSSGQIASAEALLQRDLTPEEAGEALVQGLMPSFPRLNVTMLLTKKPLQNKIDEAFDSEVKKTIEAGRVSGKKESKLSPAANVLLKQISSAQVDKTLDALIDEANFGFVDDILNKVASQHIVHFLIQLMEKGYKEPLCLEKFLAQRSRLTPEQKEEIYRVAQKTAALTVMEKIKPLSEENTGESLVAVMENMEIVRRGAVSKLLQLDNNKPSQEFIDKALVVAAKDGEFDIVERLRKEATQDGIDAGLVAAAELGHDATVKILRGYATQEGINAALEGAFNLPFEKECDRNRKKAVVTSILVATPTNPYSPAYPRDTEKLSHAINTLRTVAGKDPVIAKICGDLSRAERALQIGCQPQDVQTYLSEMNTESEIVQAKSRYPNMKTLQNAFATFLSFLGCLTGVGYFVASKVWSDNLAQRGNSFLFFDKAEKQALEVAESKLNDFLQNRR